MKRFLLITRAIALSNLRNANVLFWQFVFPVFLLVIYRFVFGSGVADVTAFMRWMLPGVIGLTMLSFGLISSSWLTADMRDKGVLYRIRATPLPVAHLLAAFGLVNGVVALLQAAVLVVIGFMLGAQAGAGELALSAVMVLLCALVSVSLGQAISAIAPKMAVALGIGQLFYFAQMFIANLIMPIDRMPEWLQTIGKATPAYAMSVLLRAAFTSGSLPADGGWQLLTLGAWLVAAVLFATRYFKWNPSA